MQDGFLLWFHLSAVFTLSRQSGRVIKLETSGRLYKMRENTSNPAQVSRRMNGCDKEDKTLSWLSSLSSLTAR